MPNQAVYFVNLWPEPRSSAAGVRTLEMSQFLQRLGYDLVGVAPGVASSHSEAWNKNGVRTLTCDPNSSVSAKDLEALSPDLVVYDRFYTEEKYGWRARELWPEALHVIDTSDLHSLRGARQRALQAGADVIHPHADFLAKTSYVKWRLCTGPMCVSWFLATKLNGSHSKDSKANVSVICRFPPRPKRC